MPLLLQVVPSAVKTYLEPFAGSACLFFALKPEAAILGDFNGELIQAYRILTKHPRRLARAIAALPATRDTYYKIRRQDPADLGDFDRAVRFVYLNRHCYNGVYRTNRQGQFNVPMGTRAGRPPEEPELYRCSVALRAARLMQDDFARTLDQAGNGDFIYADPPYSTSPRCGFGEYGYGAFSGTDMPRLLTALDTAANRGAHVLLSYKLDPQVLDHLSAWNIVTLSMKRQVGHNASRRKRTREILASNSLDLGRLSLDAAATRLGIGVPDRVSK